MSNKPAISWNAARRDLRADRYRPASLTLDWSPDSRLGSSGGWVARNDAGDRVGTVYTESGRLFALVHPADERAQPVILPGSYAINPIDLRNAQRAVEAARAASFAALKSEAA